MSIDSETFVRYAKAEKDLCQKASAVLTQIIKEIEDSHGVKIAEVRVTMDRSDSANGWSAANCVMVREHEGDPAHEYRSKEMQDQWKAMPAKDKTMMSGMMKEMSQTEDQYAADVKANGVLVVDGPAATLTVKKTVKDKNGSSTSTTTQNFKIDGSQCLVSR